MNFAQRCHITDLLLAWRQGDDSALDRLVPMVYQELRRLAHRCMRTENHGRTLATTALVNEAYIKLVDARQVRWQDRAHFLAVSAQLMRRVLVDLARARGSQKRGGRANHVEFGDVANQPQGRGRDLVQLDDALKSLAVKYPRKARVIEMRFFGGLSIQETAHALDVSEDTVLRDWRLARAWLFRSLNSVEGVERSGR